MISNITNLNPYSYRVPTGEANGKLFVPVKPTVVIYAQFDHVSGVAARKGQHGVSISKIKILNTLIENLSRIKSVSDEAPTITQMSDQQADVLINKYQQQIAQAVQTSQTSFALSGARPDAGALFSIDV